MTPLAPPLGKGEMRFWRLDEALRAPTWDSGEGSFRVGGRWNSPGTRAVYASLDPATASLEVAVHKGLEALDRRAHVLSSAMVYVADAVHVVMPTDVPNPNWLVPAIASKGQQAFGDELLASHLFILVPSAVSRHSWNVIFDPVKAAGQYGDVVQEAFALDPRLQA